MNAMPNCKGRRMLNSIILIVLLVACAGRKAPALREPEDLPLDDLDAGVGAEQSDAGEEDGGSENHEPDGGKDDEPGIDLRDASVSLKAGIASLDTSCYTDFMHAQLTEGSLLAVSHNPTELTKLIDPDRIVEHYRSISCDHYSNCLDEAVIRRWTSWTCAHCPRSRASSKARR